MNKEIESYKQWLISHDRKRKCKSSHTVSRKERIEKESKFIET